MSGTVNRRNLLQDAALLAGVVLGDSTSAAAGSPPTPLPVFFDGNLTGDDFPGWQITLVATGRRVKGTILDPSTIDRNDDSGAYVKLAGFRLKGTVNNGALKLRIYRLRDVGFRRGIGALAGRVQAGVLRGAMRLKDRREARIRATRVILSEESLAFVGQYDGSIRGPGGETLYTGLLTLSQDLSWELRDIVPAAGFPEFPGRPRRRLTGLWGVTAAGAVFMSVTQVPEATRLQVGDPQGPTDADELGEREDARTTRRTTRGPLGGGPDLTFDDAEFPDAIWTAVKFWDGSPNQDGTIRAERVTIGGNPDAFRLVSHDAPGVSSFSAAHLHIGSRFFRLAPSSPAIVRIRWHLDHSSMRDDGFPCPSVGSLCVHTPIGGRPSYYSAGSVEPEANAWNRLEVDASPGDFFKIGGPAGGDGPDSLDPSLPGTFELGFLTEGRTGGAGVDNYRVEVDLEGPPAVSPVLEIDGPSIVFLSVAIPNTIRYTVTLRDEITGLPMAGMPVGCILQRVESGGSPDTRYPVDTDDAGQAAFQFTLDEDDIGDLRVLAHLDADSSGTFSLGDPTEIRGLRGEKAEAVCNLLCFIVGETALAGSGGSAHPFPLASEGFCVPHPTLPYHTLCAEPRPPG